jgi:hypothetical protein
MLKYYLEKASGVYGDRVYILNAPENPLFSKLKEILSTLSKWKAADARETDHPMGEFLGFEFATACTKQALVHLAYMELNNEIQYVEFNAHTRMWDVVPAKVQR